MSNALKRFGEGSKGSGVEVKLLLVLQLKSETNHGESEL